MSNSTTRFSDRVEDYVKYRPHYPPAVLPFLQEMYSFGASWDVADIGSGTGISTELFLGNGNRVYAVEPNAEMRGKAEELLAGYAHGGRGAGGEGRRGAAYPGARGAVAGSRGVFVSIDGTAEATGLAAGSVRLVVAGQAFHWFDAVKSRAEFVRILRPGGVVALIWNERMTDSTFEKEYDELIREYAGEYRTVSHRNIADLQIETFFSPAAVRLDHFDNEQFFDLPGLTGRLLSSSYVPKDNPEIMKALEILFHRYARDGKVRVGYDTKLYTGVII